MARHTDTTSGAGNENGASVDGINTDIERTQIDGPEPPSDGHAVAPSDGHPDGPDVIDIAVEPEQPRKRRGRKPKSVDGTGEATSRVGVKISTRDLAAKISGAHQLAALAFGLPLLQLSESESLELATAIQEVAKYHSITIDGKLFAWLQLLATTGFIYGGRVLAVRRMREEYAEQLRRQAAEGHDLMTGEPFPQS